MGRFDADSFAPRDDSDPLVFARGSARSVGIRGDALACRRRMPRAREVQLPASSLLDRHFAPCRIGRALRAFKTGTLELLQRQISFPQRVLHQTGDVVNLQFLHDPNPIRLDGGGGDLEVLGDLLNAFAFGSQNQDFHFPRS